MKYFFVLFVLNVSSCTQNIIEPTELLGNWGNENENTDLVIKAEKAIFNFTCSTAEINTDFANEKAEIFFSDGTYMQQFGNVPEDYDPLKYTYAAVFKFTQSQGMLKVEISKKTDASPLGIFTYRKDEKVLVKKCP